MVTNLLLCDLITRHKQRGLTVLFIRRYYDRDVAEDIFQDTFIKVIKTLKARCV